MWYILRSFQRSPEVAGSAAELLTSTSRRLVAAVGGVGLLCYLFFVWSWPGTYDFQFLPSILVLLVTSALAFALLPRWFLGANAIWQAGLLAAVAVTLYFSRVSAMSFLANLLPFLAAVMVSWHAGLMVQALITLALAVLARAAGMPPLPAAYLVGITFAGTLAALLGWAAINSLVTTTGWSLFSFEQAQRNLKEAQEQRAVLQQAQADLEMANRELARLTDRLKAMYQVAEEARQAKEEFVANVSHELRTPLNMIIGFSDVITQSPEMYGEHLPPKLLADIMTIRRNGQQLSRLVDDVLDLSQIEAGRMALSRETASLAEIVESAVLAVRGLFASKGLYLETEIAADLPPAWCDRTRIRQVVINLLSNAGRFTERGGVRLAVARSGEEAVVSVSDTGPGIAAEAQGRLFEPFQQLDSSIRRRHGGSGLGLSISKRFVEMHGGKMWLESQVGVGTTIRFSLPLKPITATPPGEGSGTRWFSDQKQAYLPRLRTARGPAPDLRPRYVVVDPIGALERLLRRYMGEVELAHAEDVRQAAADLQRLPAQALLVNAYTDAAAGDPPALPYGTPMITCWVPGDQPVRTELGAQAFLAKPVSRDALLAALEQLGQGIHTVLLVDDDPDVLQLFTRFLLSSARSYRVIPASDAGQALELLRERRPDVLVLDLIMPGMDGFALLHAKNAEPAIRDIPVVVVSSQDPTKEPMIARSLQVARGSGLSARDLLGCIAAVTEVLTPSPRPNDPAPPKTPPA